MHALLPLNLAVMLRRSWPCTSHLAAVTMKPSHMHLPEPPRILHLFLISKRLQVLRARHACKQYKYRAAMSPQQPGVSRCTALKTTRSQCTRGNKSIVRKDTCSSILYYPQPESAHLSHDSTVPHDHLKEYWQYDQRCRQVLAALSRKAELLKAPIQGQRDACEQAFPAAILCLFGSMSIHFPLE